MQSFLLYLIHEHLQRKIMQKSRWLFCWWFWILKKRIHFVIHMACVLNYIICLCSFLVSKYFTLGREKELQNRQNQNNNYVSILISCSIYFQSVSGDKALHIPWGLILLYSLEEEWHMEHKLIFFFFLEVSNINFSTLQGSGSSKQSIIHKVPNKAHGIHMILILQNMCPGCSGSHLNEFAVYHYSQGRANQSLPLLSCCLSWRGQTEQDELETWGKAHWLAGDTRQCSRLPRTFPKESFWKKDEPILNSNPLMHLASPSSVFIKTD